MIFDIDTNRLRLPFALLGKTPAMEHYKFGILSGIPIALPERVVKSKALFQFFLELKNLFSDSGLGKKPGTASAKILEQAYSTTFQVGMKTICRSIKKHHIYI
jgi:hypothetical protein